MLSYVEIILRLAASAYVLTPFRPLPGQSTRVRGEVNSLVDDHEGS